MRQETLALIEAALDAAGAEGLARTAAAEELARLVEAAVAIEARPLIDAAVALIDGFDWEWLASDPLPARWAQHEALSLALNRAFVEFGAAES